MRRVDYGKINTVQELPNGSIRVRVRVGRDGLHKYRMPDGSERIEYRSPEALRASVATLKDLPIVVGHPRAKVLTPAEWRALAHGHVSDVEPELEADGGHNWAHAWAVVSDPETIGRIRSKDLCETSLGQLVDPNGYRGPGRTPAGEPFTAEQPAGIANHLSLEMAGRARAGNGCRVLTDSLDEVGTMDPELKELLQRVTKLEADLAAVTAEKEALRVKLDAAETAVGSASAERDTLKAQLDSVDVDAIVASELSFRETSRAKLPADYSFEGKTRRQVMLDSVKHLGGTIADDAPESTLSAYLDGLAVRVPVVDSKDKRPSGALTPDQIRAQKRADALKGIK